MSAINPIQGSSAAGMNPRAAAAPPRNEAPTKSSFGQTLADVIGQVDRSQQASQQAVGDLLTGRGEIEPVVAAAAKADLSFKLLIGVRNKVIEAYKQTLNMQV